MLFQLIIIYFLLETDCLMIVVIIGYYTIKEKETQVDECMDLYFVIELVA